MNQITLLKGSKKYRNVKSYVILSDYLQNNENYFVLIRRNYSIENKKKIKLVCKNLRKIEASWSLNSSVEF